MTAHPSTPASTVDTIGQSLVTSGFLLDQYFQSANRLVETRLGRTPRGAAATRVSSECVALISMRFIVT